MGIFNESKTLIVVYEDEMLMNQFKKLVETDKEQYENVKIVSWSEKVWNDNKKKGNIDSKILFLGDIDGADKLTPVIDVKYNEYGIRYGWAGKQAIVYATVKELENSNYDDFFEKLSVLPVPDMIKKRVQDEEKKDAEEKPETEKKEEAETEEQKKDDNVEVLEGTVEENTEEKKKGKPNFFDIVGGAIKDGADAVGSFVVSAGKGVGSFAVDVGNNVASFAQDVMKDRGLMRRQMMFYGVLELCKKDLDEFMNS